MVQNTVTSDGACTTPLTVSRQAPIEFSRTFGVTHRVYVYRLPRAGTLCRIKRK